MRERDDRERLDWLLEQNRLGYNMQYVTTRADVDELMAMDEAGESFPLRANSDTATISETRDG